MFWVLLNTCSFLLQQQTAQQKGITSVPTFHFYKGGSLIKEIKGASPGALESLIKEHQGPVDETAAIPALNGHVCFPFFVNSYKRMR